MGEIIFPINRLNYQITDKLNKVVSANISKSSNLQTMNKFLTHLTLLVAMLCFAMPSFGQIQSDNIAIRPPTAAPIPINNFHCFVSISPQFSIFVQ